MATHFLCLSASRLQDNFTVDLSRSDFPRDLAPDVLLSFLIFLVAVLSPFFIIIFLSIHCCLLVPQGYTCMVMR